MSLSHRFASTNGGFERVPSLTDMQDTLDPKDKKHTCTDPVCLLVFVLCIFATLLVSIYAFNNGDPRRIYHGVDFKGNVCGVDVPHPYIYWCSKGSGKRDDDGLVWFDIDPLSPICVSECPRTSAGTHSCWSRSSSETVIRQDYATHKIGNRACVPQNQKMLDEVQGKRIGNFITKYPGEVVECLKKSWPVPIAAVIIAIILAYAYLMMLRNFAGLIVYACLLVSFFVPATYGGYLLYAWQTGNGVDGIPGSGDSETDLFIGIACCVGSAIFLAIACCMSGAVNRAVRCVETAAVCMFRTPSLLLEPFLLAFSRAVWLIFLVSVLVHLAGTGEPQPPDEDGNPQLFKLKPEQSMMIIFIVVMIVWMNDLCSALSQTAVASAVCNWYFTEKTGGVKQGAPGTALASGYVVAFTHLGSLALGAITLAVTRPVRIVLLICVSAADLVDNGLCGCLSQTCSCCYQCFDAFMAALSKNAYIDIAVQGSNFCQATNDAFKVMCSESKAIMILNGATWVFTMAGLGVVTGVTALIAFFTVQNQSKFNTPASEYYVEDPVVMTVICGCISFIIAVCFMLTFDMVADTMLYCFAYERRWHKLHPAAESRREEPQSTGFFSSFGWGGLTKKEPAKKAVPKMSKYAPEELNFMVNSVEQRQLVGPGPTGQGFPTRQGFPR